MTVSGGFGGYFRGWEQVERNTEMAASRFIDGVVTGFENVTKYATPDLAYTVDIGRFSAKLVGKGVMVPVALRVTSIFRHEEGRWKLDLVTGTLSLRFRQGNRSCRRESAGQEISFAEQSSRS